MLVFRISTARYARDLTGTGARIHGGRWSHKGINVVYTSESRALATTEYLVRTPMGMIPVGLRMVMIQIPKNTSTETIGPAKLPAHWRIYPVPIEIADFGFRWVVENRSLTLRVPSAVVPGDFNILINPSHPENKKVKIKSVEPYELDERLLASR